MIGLASVLMVATSASPAGDGVAWDYRFDCNVEGTQEREGVPAIELPAEQWVIEFSNPSLLSNPGERASAILSLVGSDPTAPVKLVSRSWSQRWSRYETDKPAPGWRFGAAWEPLYDVVPELRHLRVDQEDGQYLLKATGHRRRGSVHNPKLYSLKYKGTCNLMAGHSA